MKNSVLLCLVWFSFDIYGQILVPETTRSMYGVVEATWCGNCGQYGHPATADIIDQSGSKAIYLSLHKSGSSELYAATASGLATAFGAVGQPFFTVNGQALGAYSGTIVSETVAAIDSYYNEDAADVNAGFEYGIVGDSLYVYTKTTFFNAMSGEYYTAVYVYEDSIWEWQANYDPGIPDMDITHNHILRTSMNGVFGVPVASGSIAAATSINGHWKIALDPSWDPSQLHVITVVWKKNGSIYEFVNANDTGSIITGQTGIPEPVTDDVLIYPNPVNDKFYIAGINLPAATVNVYDMAGNVLAGFTEVYSFDVHLLPPGVYMVQIHCGDQVLVRKMIKE